MTDPLVSQGSKVKKPRIWVALLPLIIFASLAGLFTWQLMSGHNAQEIPSALIGKSAPDTDLPHLDGLLQADGRPIAGLNSKDFIGQVTLVNVWASWCVPCREEHPQLLQLAQDKRFRLVGLNYKDKPENAKDFLQSLGNPYAAVGTDQSGRAGIDWGVYGVPETFVVNAQGEITYKFVGPLSETSLHTDLMPMILQVLQK